MIVKRGPMVFVGTFPPPFHGNAIVNAAVCERLRQVGVVPFVIDLAARNLNRSILSRFGRIPKILCGFVALLYRVRPRGGVLYMSVSAGLGQIYELAFVVLARVRGMRLFLHHHTYAYIDKWHFCFMMLAKMSGSQAVHVALSPLMVSRLKEIYGLEKVICISNAVFFVEGNANSDVPPRQKLRTLGFLSNIAAEKGVFEFLDLMIAIREAGLPVSAELAGPFQDAEIEFRVRERLESLAGVKYVGPKYGADKEEFFAGIDVLVFPTRYINEAEPLIMHEAMSRGIPVIAYGRGAIPEIVGSECGRIIDPSDDFVLPALDQIRMWLGNAALFRVASLGAHRRFIQTRMQNEREWDMLLKNVISGYTQGEFVKRG